LHVPVPPLQILKGLWLSHLQITPHNLNAVFIASLPYSCFTDNHYQNLLFQLDLIYHTFHVFLIVKLRHDLIYSQLVFFTCFYDLFSC
jgi:hypothetical protein